jgi:exonuclease SbcD
VSLLIGFTVETPGKIGYFGGTRQNGTGGKVKILHTSDWHLGKRLGPYSRMEEQRRVMEEICVIAKEEKPDLVLVTGDLYDTFNPPAEAVDLLYRTLKNLTRGGTVPVVALAGNHDSPERIEAPDPLARECGIFFLGYPDTLLREMTLESGTVLSFPEPGMMIIEAPHLSSPVRLMATPYANENRLRRCLAGEDRETALRQLLKERWALLSEKYCTPGGVNLLAGHFFAAPGGDLFSQDPEEPDGERPILHPGGLELIYTDSFPESLQYVALGHLHRPQELSGGPCPVVYPGSPLAYSLSEKEQEKRIVMVEAEPGRPVKVRSVALRAGRKIHRERFSSEEQALEWLRANPDTLVEIQLETRDFIAAETKQRLFEAHDAILALIPVLPPGEREPAALPLEDRERSIPDLFTDYFKSLHGGTAPGRELLDLLSELLALDGEAAE